MKTATEEAPRPKSANSSGKPSFLPEDVEKAIKNAFPVQCRQLGTPSIRYLWTDGSVHRYRVNWWSSTNSICESKFLHVTGGNGKYQIKTKIEVKEI